MLVIAGGVAGAAYGALVALPPYLANKGVQEAVAQELGKANPDLDDESLINNINRVLHNTHTSHYWVDDSGHHEDDYLNLTDDEVTFNRDDDPISADVTYTQQMWVPILGRERDFTYSFHAVPAAK